jgi:hypothetical protein
MKKISLAGIALMALSASVAAADSSVTCSNSNGRIMFVGNGTQGTPGANREGGQTDSKELSNPNHWLYDRREIDSTLGHLDLNTKKLITSKSESNYSFETFVATATVKIQGNDISDNVICDSIVVKDQHPR